MLAILKDVLYPPINPIVSIYQSVYRICQLIVIRTFIDLYFWVLLKHTKYYCTVSLAISYGGIVAVSSGFLGTVEKSRKVEKKHAG